MSKRNPDKKGVFKEFAEFINKGNAVALAIGVIIGGAFSNIVGTINTKIISPIIGWLIGDADLSQELITPLAWGTDPDTGEAIITNGIYWGALIQAIIDFLLTAVILFAITKLVTSAIKKAQKAKELIAKKENETPAEPEPVVEAEPVIPEDIKLLSEIRDLLANNKKDK